jgi:N-succinyldiaminopimelate aminotransferase
LKRLIDLAQQHDFLIASDECYSEIYYDESQPPKGLLQVAYENGYDNFQRCIAFYSLSKRSNAPGLRSGFVVGDPAIIAEFLKYRTYHGCAMPVSTQLASIAAWDDENHVIANRATYRTNFENVVQELSKLQPVNIPPAGFYIWLPTPIDDEQFALGLYSQQNVTVLPGKYLAREVNQQNPGTNHVRIALVASPAECRTAAQRINQFIKSLS